MADNYGIGYKWIAGPDGDWTPRTAADHATTNGNPDDDAFGNAVWSYEYYYNVAPGSRLDSATPWYNNPTAPMIWDNSWYGGEGLWAADDDLTPAATGVGMSSRARETRFALTRWINPSAETKIVRIANEEAQVVFGWANDLTDVAICHWDDSEGNLNILFSDTINAPDNFDYPNNNRSSFNYDISVTVNPGDSIVWTGYHVGLGDWTNLQMAPSVEVIPEPSSAMLIAVAGLSGWWIRRTFVF